MPANIRILKTPFRDEKTGKPQLWEFDLSDPMAAEEYSTFRNLWAMKPRAPARPGRPAGASSLEYQQEGAMLPSGKDIAMLMAMGAGAGVGGLAARPLAAVLQSPRAIPFLGSMLGAGTGAGTMEGMAGGDEESVRNAATGGMAADVVGRGLSAGAQGMGRTLMRSAMGPPEWLSRNYPASWRGALRNEIGLGQPRTAAEGPEPAGMVERLLGNKTPSTGAEAAKFKIGQADQIVQRALKMQQAKRMDLKNTLAEVRRRLLGPSGKFGRRPSRAIEVQETNRVLADIEQQNPGAFSMERAHNLKRGAQEASTALLEKSHDARKSGAMIDRSAEVEEIVNRELAAVLRDRLGKDVPGYNAAESHVQELMGVERAMRYRESMPPEGITPRAGNTSFRIDPLGLFPEHARSQAARTLYGPGAAVGRVAPYLFPFAQPDSAR